MNLYIDNNKPNIVIFGDIMLDHNIQGVCNKIANEGPIPVVHFTEERYSIGGCGNVLLNTIVLGASNIFLFSRIGLDENGIKLKSLIPNNTNISYIIEDNTLPTITKTRIYSDKKIVSRYDIEKIISITNEQEKQIVDNFMYTIKNNQISTVIFSDYNKGFLTKSLCQSIINLCNKYEIPTIVDPKVDYTKYIGCTVIKPNKNETKNIFNLDLNVKEYEECHKSIESTINCKMSVITLSGDGISAYANNKHYKVNEDTKDVIDVTGAGDIVCAVIGTYYPFIKDINTLIAIANHLASISVGHLGVYTITDGDLINTHRFIKHTKIINLDILKNMNCDNVVFTNGCFDILHSAHIELFKFCKSLGKIVIVGLNSDESIKRLKGDKRPIYKLEDRLKILESIEYIDYIIPFEEDTPLELIKIIKPNYLVKGGDYTKDTVVGKEYTNNVVIFDYISNISTTNTIMKLGIHDLKAL
jgi:D-beta-D-heptose 7-phosphate kinase/D-beta-D-heptose 1-phosphate adenosyltransferase